MVTIAVVALGAMAVFLLAAPLGGDTQPVADAPSDVDGLGPDTPPPGAQALPATGPDTLPPGLDDELDDLWLACADEDWAACDDLSIRSDFDSDYEFFGATCGTRDFGTGGGDLCQNLHAADGALPVVLPDALAPGMCFDEPAEDELVFWVPTVTCEQPHDVEIMGLVELSESSFPTDMTAVAFDRCEPIFADFVGLAYPESVLDIYHLSPTQESWSLGDRGIACGVYDPAGPVEGSLEGVAR